MPRGCLLTLFVPFVHYLRSRRTHRRGVFIRGHRDTAYALRRRVAKQARDDSEGGSGKRVHMESPLVIGTPSSDCSTPATPTAAGAFDWQSSFRDISSAFASLDGMFVVPPARAPHGCGDGDDLLSEECVAQGQVPVTVATTPPPPLPLTSDCVVPESEHAGSSVNNETVAVSVSVHVDAFASDEPLNSTVSGYDAVSTFYGAALLLEQHAADFMREADPSQLQNVRVQLTHVLALLEGEGDAAAISNIH